MPSPSLPIKQGIFKDLVVTATGSKNIDIIVPAGKYWRICGITIAGAGDGNTVTSSVRLLSIVWGLDVNTSRKRLTNYAIDNTTSNIGGTGGAPWILDYLNSQFYLFDGETLRANIIVNAFTTQETYTFSLWVEEYDIPGAQTSQF